MYSAAPDVRIVASAVDVRSTADGSHASRTPALSRWAAISSPWASRRRARRQPGRAPQPGQRDRDVRRAAAGVLVPPTARGLHDVDQRLPHHQHAALHGPRLYHPLVQGWDGVRTDQHRAWHPDPRSRSLVDLLTGIVLSVIGVSQDKQELAIVGVVLAHRRCRDARLRGLDAEQARTAVSSFVLYGAGAVGGVIGSRLSLAGHDVTVSSLVASTWPGSSRTDWSSTPAGTARCPGTRDRHRGRSRVARRHRLVVLAVKSHQTEAALADLVRHAPEIVPVVCAQNGVSNEPATLRRFAHTYAITVTLPSSTSSRASSSRAATRCRATSTSAATRPAQTR